ncbi:MAG: hypothetical protein NT022_02935, partial [Deltaproteobacteria bacterium]|nr:hypothetical protein [Deltaproteobacteria bacterium]
MKSKIIVAVCMIVSVIFLCAGLSFSQEKVSGSEWTQIIEQMGDKGKINWSEGYIDVSGGGAVDPARVRGSNSRLMCLRAAKMDAYRNFLEIAKGVQLDSSTTVKDFITQSDTISAQVSGIVRGAKPVGDPSYLSDGTCEVTLRVPFAGSFAQLVLPKALEKKPEVAPPAAPPAAPAPAGVIFTGMVIDARGIQARPAMSPRILDENGKEVYGSMNVDREYAVQQGMSGYARDLTAAQSNPRV